MSIWTLLFYITIKTKWHLQTNNVTASITTNF